MLHNRRDRHPCTYRALHQCSGRALIAETSTTAFLEAPPCLAEHGWAAAKGKAAEAVSAAGSPDRSGSGWNSHWPGRPHIL